MKDLGGDWKVPLRVHFETNVQEGEGSEGGEGGGREETRDFLSLKEAGLGEGKMDEVGELDFVGAYEQDA